MEEPDVTSGLYPPTWSPNGESLAFLGYESTSGERQACLYMGTVEELEFQQLRANRPSPYRVTEATGPPSWSPDAQYIAFTRSGGEDAGVYVVRPNGNDLRRIADGSSQGPLWPSDVTELPENVNTVQRESGLDFGTVTGCSSSQGRLPSIYPGTQVTLCPAASSPPVWTAVTLSNWTFLFRISFG